MGDFRGDRTEGGGVIAEAPPPPSRLIIVSKLNKLRSILVTRNVNSIFFNRGRVGERDMPPYPLAARRACGAHTWLSVQFVI